ncbi:MAG: hypothetical protein HY943_02345 [Gammaproteobacteria bacterium]|nr:hypothetical protein [Gammaproteobacteria bacterium]
MYVTGSDLASRSTHTVASERTVHESLRAWAGNRPDVDVRVARPIQAAAASGNSAPANTVTEQANPVAAGAEAAENDPRLQMLRVMIEKLLGRKVETIAASDLELATSPAALPAAQPATNGRAARAGWGVEYTRQERLSESEQTVYTARGLVRTSDGKEITVELSLAMSRAYSTETNVSLRAGDAVLRDPLVVNFNGTAAELLPARFRFDLNGDGKPEDVPLLADGHGYLVLDANANGRVDSGRELFGPATGQGFAELAHHDADGNGWIDERDLDYGRLAVWHPAADGTGELQTLAERGVAAIALAGTATPFELHTAENTALGAVRATSIFLDEQERAGTVQQIDVSV